MTSTFRFSPGPALAALALVLFETVRAVFFGTTELSISETFTVFISIAGVLGTTLGCLGILVTWLVWSLSLGWRDVLSSTSPGRRVASTVFTLFAMALILLAVHLTVLKAAGAFRKDIYVGLAGGLAALCSLFSLLAIAPPCIIGLTKLIDLWPEASPTWLNPKERAGAVTSLLIGVIALLFIVPAVYQPLHTVDMRPPRLLALWAALLVVGYLLSALMDRGRAVTIGLSAGVFFVASLSYSAISLGSSQACRVNLNRDTILSGRLISQFARLGDSDGDGSSRWFGGGDCNDLDPRIHPGRYDIPDDGVDQNCTGSDLVLKERRVPKPVRVTPRDRNRWNVILLTVDALRFDTYRAHMPRLNEVAKDSVDFTNAYSHGAATYWSIPSLLTSKMPSRLEMGRDQTPVSREELLTETLRDQGWHTALFANVTIFFVRGLRQGTHVANYDTSHFTVHGAKPGSAHMTDGLLNHIDKWSKGSLRPKRDRFFLWGHYYDPHDPYFAVPGFPATESGDQGKYEAIVRYTDQEIGRLIDGLKSRGLWENTMLIVTSDHGDEFLEHGGRFHGRTLYEEMTHVPLLLRIPGSPGRLIDNPIGQVEVAPTVLDLLGLSIPPSYEGRSRAGEALTGEASPPQPVFLEVFPDSNYSGHQVAVRHGKHKLIYRLNENLYELYDLEADPAERRNLYDQHPEASALKELLGWYVDRHLFSLAQGKTGAKKPAGSPPKRVRKPAKKSRKKRAKPRSPLVPRAVLTSPPKVEGVRAPGGVMPTKAPPGRAKTEP